MPTYSAIATSELAVNKPLTSSLMTRVRDNPLAIFAQLGWAVTGSVSVSAEQTITAGGTVTISHGLTFITNAYDIDVMLYLKCISTEGGYTTNDIVPISPSGQGSSGNTGISTTVTTTQVIIRYGSSGLNITQATTGAAFTITAANWKLLIKTRG
jgi:hypothetical protein